VQQGEDFTINNETPWTRLLNGGRLAVGDPEHVPAGIYAKEALQKLGAWETLSPTLAPAEDVRGALALVERNEAPLGIVYGSDAVASKGRESGCVRSRKTPTRKWNILLRLLMDIKMRP
jgi:molybdate transport system substrate-binding protein